MGDQHSTVPAAVGAAVRATGTRRWLPVAFLVLGLVFGAVAYLAAARVGDATDHTTFQRDVERSTEAFQTQLDRIEMALNAVHGLHAGERVTTDAYRAFVAQLAAGSTLSERFIGVAAVGFAHERDGTVAFQMVEPAGTSVSFADVRRHPELTAGLWRSVDRDDTTIVSLDAGLPGPSAVVAPLSTDTAGGPRSPTADHTAATSDLHGWSLIFLDEDAILRHATRGEDLLATVRPGPAAGTEVAGAGPRADAAHSVPTLDDVDASTRVGLGGTQWQLDFARPTGGVGQWFQRRQASLFSGLSVVAIVWLMGWSINAQMSGRRRAEVAVEQATESLRDQEQRFRTLAAASPIGIFLTDARGQVTYANHRLAAILGVHRQRLLDDGLWTYLQPDPLARGRLLQRLSADPEQAVRCTPITEAEDQALSLRATALVDAEGEVIGYTGTVEDITEQVDAHEQLAEREATNRALADRFAHQARHDALTGIPNRVLLLERLSALNEPSEDAAGDLALVLLDLDGFKLINDTLGHAAGDDLLVAISQRLTTCLREDDLLVRLGGDEFAVLLSSGHQPEAALQLADRLLATIQRPVELARETVSVGASLGVAQWTGRGTDPEELLQQADLAMYAAKEAGRGRVELFLPELGTATHHRHTLERELRNALEQDRLEPAFQPVVDVGTGRIVGVEALARWHHPTLGTVPPAEFIPVAEHAGLIPLLGRRIRHRALSAAQRWWTEHAVQTGINVSARELTEPGYAERLLEEITSHHLPTRAVVVEVTESQLATGSTAVEELQVLRTHGVEVAIDDFGAGYSSLARLRTMPVDVLKIDGSFIAALDEPGGGSLVEAVVQLGDTLGYETVAEGVETATQLRFLRTVGCDLAQGYHLHEPLSADTITELLQAGRATATPALAAVVP